MISRSGSSSVLYNLQRSLVTIFYLISVVSIFWLIFYLMHEVFQIKGIYILFTALLYLVLCVLAYGFIHVITYIPANLAGAFDPLKNDIASGRIRNSQELAERLAAFLTGFFNFAFFDVKACQVNIRGKQATTSEDEGEDPEAIDPSEIASLISETGECTLVGRQTMKGYRGYLYVIPLVFGEDELGYMAVVTRQRLWKIFMRLLSEFENDYVDDQVIHILGHEEK